MLDSAGAAQGGGGVVRNMSQVLHVQFCPKCAFGVLHLYKTCLPKGGHEQLETTQMLRNIALNLAVAISLSSIPQLAQAQTKTPKTQVQSLIGQYRAGSDLVRPTIARQLNRVFRRIPVTTETASLRAQALTIASMQAAREGRKDIALTSAQQAMSLAAALSNGEGKSVRAQAAVAVARAQLMHQEHLAAITTMLAARREYGALQSEIDPIWDELLLWETLAQTSAPARLAEQIAAVTMTGEESALLHGLKGYLCNRPELGFRRDRTVGREPIFPALSLFANLQGGVVLRHQLSSDGTIISTQATAFTPTEGFAAAAEIAARTWVYTIPPDQPASCRENVLTVLAFNIR